MIVSFTRIVQCSCIYDEQIRRGKEGHGCTYPWYQRKVKFPQQFTLLFLTSQQPMAV